MSLAITLPAASIIRPGTRTAPHHAGSVEDDLACALLLN